MSQKTIPSRAFMDEIDSKDPLKQRALKAYLKGQTHFKYKGVTYTVMQIYFPKPIKK